MGKSPLTSSTCAQGALPGSPCFHSLCASDPCELRPPVDTASLWASHYAQCGDVGTRWWRPSNITLLADCTAQRLWKQGEPGSEVKFDIPIGLLLQQSNLYASSFFSRFGNMSDWLLAWSYPLSFLGRLKFCLSLGSLVWTFIGKKVSILYNISTLLLSCDAQCSCCSLIFSIGKCLEVSYNTCPDCPPWLIIYCSTFLSGDPLCWVKIGPY